MTDPRWVLLLLLTGCRSGPAEPTATPTDAAGDASAPVGEGMPDDEQADEEEPY